MKNNEKLIKANQETSRKKTEIAKNAMEKMYRENRVITIAKLIKMTGLSRSFFYNNQEIHKLLIEYKEAQGQNQTVDSDASTIIKAMEKRIRFLEENTVPKEEYKRILTELNKVKNGKLYKIYDEIKEAVQ